MIYNPETKEFDVTAAMEFHKALAEHENEWDEYTAESVHQGELPTPDDFMFYLTCLGLRNDGQPTEADIAEYHDMIRKRARRAKDRPSGICGHRAQPGDEIAGDPSDRPSDQVNFSGDDE